MKINSKKLHKLINNNELNWNAGNIEITTYLVENNANIKAKDRYGRTPQDLANQNGKWKCQYLLLRDK